MSYVLSELTEPHFAYFSSLKGKTGHISAGLFIAEGPKITEVMLRSDAQIPYALMTREYLEHFLSLLGLRAQEPTLVHVAEKSAMEQIVGYSLHQGVMLAVRIPKEPILDQIVSGSGQKTIVILEGIADAENMGTLIRTAAGFGVDAVIVDQTCCDPFLRRSVRVSMGTVINVPIIRTKDLPQVLKVLKLSSFHLVAAALKPDSVELSRVSWGERVAMMFGAEGVGLTDGTLSSADLKASIPMASGIDSFNVGVASGVFLHERKRSIT